MAMASAFTEWQGMMSDTLSEITSVAGTVAQIAAGFIPGAAPALDAIMEIAKLEPEAAALFHLVVGSGTAPTGDQLAALNTAVAARKSAEAQAAAIDAGATGSE